MKRIIAHLLFGFSVAGTIGKIPLYNNWVNFEYWLFALFVGFIAAVLGEFAQWSWNDSLKPFDGHKFQKSDVAKNYGGVVAGCVALYFFPVLFWPSLAVLVGIIGYAVYCIINKKAI